MFWYVQILYEPTQHAHNGQDDKIQGSNADEEEDDDFLVQFADCQRLHYLQTHLGTAKRALGCCSDLADRLGDDWSRWVLYKDGPYQDALKSYKKEITAFQENLDLMIERASRISSLVRQHEDGSSCAKY